MFPDNLYKTSVIQRAWNIYTLYAINKLMIHSELSILCGIAVIWSVCLTQAIIDGLQITLGVPACRWVVHVDQTRY